MANLAKEIIIKVKDLTSEAFNKIKTSIKDTSSAADKGSAEFDELGASVTKLTAQERKLQIEQEKLSNSTQKLTLEQQKLDKSNTELSKEYANATTKEQKASVTRKQLANDTKQLTLNQRKLTNEQKSLSIASKKAAASQEQLTKSTKSFGGILGTTTQKLIAFAGAYIGLRKIKDGFLEILNVGSKFETLKVQLEAVMGTVEGGEAAFKWIKEFAKNTPLQLDGVTKAFVKMKAFGLDPMDGTMQKLTDAAAKMGGGQEKLEGIILAVGQAWTKGKLQAEEANQLIERGVPVWDLLAKALGRTTAELQEMSAKGQITRTEIKLLIDEIGASSEGAAAAQMDTWAGLISNLGDTWTTFLNTIAESGTLDYFKEQLESLLTKTKEMAADGSLKQWAKDISDGIIAVGSAVKSTVGFIVEYSSAIVALGTAYAGLKVTGIVAGLASVAAGLITSTVATTAATAATTAATTASAAFNTAYGKTAALLRLGLWSLAAKEAYDVYTAYVQLTEQQDKLATAQKELDENTTARLAQMKEEAELLGLSISAYGDNTAAIAEAIVQKREEIAANAELIKSQRDFVAEVDAAVKAGQDQAKQQAELSTEAGKAAQAIQELGESEKELTDDTGNTADAIKKLSDDAITDLLTKIEQVNSTELFTGSGWDDLKNGLLHEQFERIGLDFDVIAGRATEAGTEGSQAFRNIAESAGLTKDQIAQVAQKLIEAANTAADVDLLRQTFVEMGVEINNHPALITAIVKKIQEMGGSLEGIPQKWIAIAGATDSAAASATRAAAAANAYADSVKRAANQQQHFNDLLAQEAVAIAANANAQAARDAQREADDQARNQESSFRYFDEGTKSAYATLTDDSLRQLGDLIANSNKRLAQSSGNFGSIDVASAVNGLATAQTQAAASAARTEKYLANIESQGKLEKALYVNVKLDGREIAASLERSRLTAR